MCRPARQRAQFHQRDGGPPRAGGGWVRAKLAARRAWAAPVSDSRPRAVIASMARYTASLETPLPPSDTFAYLSDFSTTEEWDPGVREAMRLGEGPIGAGTEFRVSAQFLGRTNVLTYRVVEFEPDTLVTL